MNGALEAPFLPTLGIHADACFSVAATQGHVGMPAAAATTQVSRAWAGKTRLSHGHHNSPSSPTWVLKERAVPVEGSQGQDKVNTHLLSNSLARSEHIII